MKLKINGFENEIVFSDDTINVLQISDAECFAHILETINNKVNGLEAEEIFLLDDNNSEMNMERNVYFCCDVFNLDYNSKKILTKLYKIISDNIQLNQDFVIDDLTLKMRNYIIEEINELPFEFTMKSGLDVVDVLKLFDLKIDNTSCTNILERLEILINLISTLDIAKVLIVPNLKLYLSCEKLLELYKYSLYNNVNLLLVEKSNDSIKLEYEEILFVDDSFNDFIL